MEDGMKLGTSFIRPIINRFIEKKIRKQLGVDVIVDLSNAVVEFKDNTATIDISFKAKTSKDDLEKLINKLAK